MGNILSNKNKLYNFKYHNSNTDLKSYYYYLIIAADFIDSNNPIRRIICYSALYNIKSICKNVLINHLKNLTDIHLNENEKIYGLILKGNESYIENKL